MVDIRNNKPRDTGNSQSQTEFLDMKSVCSRMINHHDEQLALCAKLEELADELPDVSDTRLCLQLAKQIQPMISDAHNYEESTLFPALMTDGEDGGELKSTIERLRYEHWEDESFANEVSDGLVSFVMDKRSLDPVALAYMLRGFFEGLRRHIAFEREHILPLLIARKQA
jgi:hemerythrin-like domain-containing protein